MDEITVRRAKQYKMANRNDRRDWKWTYDYRVPGETAWRQYGNCLASLKDLLKRKFKGVPVNYTWK